MYTADGAGSGTWGAFPSPLVNEVIVSSKSAFPAPVAGIITLADNTTYRIDGNINIGTDRLVLGANTGLVGTNRFLDFITYTGTGVMLTATQTFKLEELKFVCASGTLLGLTGTSTESCVITNCFSDDCDTVGTITTWGNFIGRSFSLTSMTTAGLTFVGANTAISMDNSLWNVPATITGIDLGTATFERVQIESGNRFITAATGTAMSIAANSANINSGGFGSINDVVFDGSGTAINGFDKADIRWSVHSRGVVPSEKDADIYLQGNATGTSATTTPTIVAGSTWVEAAADQFTTTSGGRITYIGVDPTGFAVSASIHAAATSGSSQSYFFYIAVNGTAQTASRSKREFTTSTPGALGIHAHVELVNGDYLELFVEKETGSDTITIDDAHIVVSQVN